MLWVPVIMISRAKFGGKSFLIQSIYIEYELKVSETKSGRVGELGQGRERKGETEGEAALVPQNKWLRLWTGKIL